MRLARLCAAFNVYVRERSFVSNNQPREWNRAWFMGIRKTIKVNNLPIERCSEQSCERQQFWPKTLRRLRDHCCLDIFRHSAVTAAVGALASAPRQALLSSNRNSTTRRYWHCCNHLRRRRSLNMRQHMLRKFDFITSSWVCVPSHVWVLIIGTLILIKRPHSYQLIS